MEATTGWRFVLEELKRAGAAVQLAEPADTTARGPKRRAKTDKARRAPLVRPADRTAAANSLAALIRSRSEFRPAEAAVAFDRTVDPSLARSRGANAPRRSLPLRAGHQDAQDDPGDGGWRGRS